MVNSLNVSSHEKKCIVSSVESPEKCGALSLILVFGWSELWLISLEKLLLDQTES